MKVFNKALLRILSVLFVTIILILSIVPLLWVVVSSLNTNKEILSATLGYPNGPQYDNYAKALRLAPIARFYVNSLIICLCSTTLNIILMAMAAYPIARFRFRFRSMFRTLFYVALLVPGAALLLPLYLTVNSIGLYDSKLGMILVYAGFGMPTSLFTIMSYYLTIPRELEESSYIDGAGFSRTFFQIVFPLAKPAYATAFILAFLNSWKEFQFALVLTNSDNSRTLPIALYYFKSQFSTDYGSMFAATTMVVLPSIFIYLLMQKQIVAGLVSGSVKG